MANYQKQNEYFFNGQRLRLARELRSISLKQLGEQVASSSRYLRRLENEPIQPKEDLTLALADAINVDHTFFSRNASIETDSPFYFRKLSSTTQQAEATAVAHAEIFDEFVNFIEKYVDLPKVDIPERTPDSNDLSSIERIAETCRMYWGLGLDTPIVNMCQLLEHIGVIVTEFDSVTRKVDAFSWVGHRPIVVRSELKRSGSRARFDLAHELGHLVMHRQTETGDKITEMRAHRFASAFLLPQAAFRREFPTTNELGFRWRSLFELKERWKVSIQAIVRRAFDLEIIGAAAYRRANIYIAKKGWKKSEPYEPELEKPELISNAMKSLREHLHISNDQVIENVGLDCSMFYESSEI